MAEWLAPVRAALESAVQPKKVFFRDDDAGWEHDRLHQLLEVFAQTNVPIDLAVIPAALENDLAETLIKYQKRQPLGLHQHGFSHTNHETQGRKCEFGDSRNSKMQTIDIANGQARLRYLLGKHIDPIFTPPWNRCTQTTIACLELLDFRVLSRESRAAKLHTSTLEEMPVHVDWSKFLKTSAEPLLELGRTIAEVLQRNALSGIMLHHADMDKQSLEPLAELLMLFSSHQNVQGTLLRDVAGCN